MKKLLYYILLYNIEPQRNPAINEIIKGFIEWSLGIFFSLFYYFLFISILFSMFYYFLVTLSHCYENNNNIINVVYNDSVMYIIL